MRDEWDVSDIRHVTIYEDTELSPSNVLNMFGEPFALYKPKQPIGFDLTRKNKK